MASYISVVISTISGQQSVYEAEPESTFRGVKLWIAKKWKIPVLCQKLVSDDLLTTRKKLGPGQISQNQPLIDLGDHEHLSTHVLASPETPSALTTYLPKNGAPVIFLTVVIADDSRLKAALNLPDTEGELLDAVKDMELYLRQDKVFAIDALYEKSVSPMSAKYEARRILLRVLGKEVVLSALTNRLTKAVIGVHMFNERVQAAAWLLELVTISDPEALRVLAESMEEMSRWSDLFNLPESAWSENSRTTSDEEQEEENHCR